MAISQPSTPTDVSAKHAPAKAGRPSLARWQERVLPVMITMLIGLAAFFFIATMFQMAYLQRTIAEVPTATLPTAVVSDSSLQDSAVSAIRSSRELEIRASMEAYLAERRYHYSSVLLMAGLWTRYLGFVTGMVLALVGASFILGKLEGPPSELEGKGAGAEGSLKTASPGIILVVLGAVLMLATIVDRDAYDVHDTPIYLPAAQAAATVQTTPIPGPTSMPVETFAAPARNR